MDKDDTQAIDPANNEQELELDLTSDETAKDSPNWEAEAKRYKAEVTRLKKHNTEKPIINPQEQLRPADILKSPEFRLHREGYTEKEIEVIMNNGGPTILEDKANIITTGIQVSREQRQAEEASAKASGASGMSDIERKYTEQDMRNMSKEDLAKLLPHIDN